MENVQDATEDDSLFTSKIYVLDHSNIISDKKSNTFNISGIFEDRIPNFGKIDLKLKVNVEKGEEVLESEIDCKIVEIKGYNYVLYCTGEKNTLYDLQSAVSTINSDLLVINFDEHVNSEITLNYNENSHTIKKKSSGGISGGIIALIVVLCLVVVAAVITIVLLRKKIFKKAPENAVDSTVINLET